MVNKTLFSQGGGSEYVLRMYNGTSASSFDYKFNVGELIIFDVTLPSGATVKSIDVNDQTISSSSYTVSGNKVYGSVRVTEAMRNYGNYKFVDITSTSNLSSSTINKFIVVTDNQTKEQIASNHTLRVVWASTNTLSVNPNEGRVNVDGSYYSTTRTVTKGPGDTTIVNDPKRTGYDFMGWSQSGTCGNYTSTSGAGTYTHPANLGTTCTLTAGWNSSTSNTTSSVTLPAAPTKQGYAFAGWKTGNTTLQPGVSYTPTASVTFTAQWMEVTASNVSYNRNGQATVQDAIDDLYEIFVGSS